MDDEKNVLKGLAWRSRFLILSDMYDVDRKMIELQKKGKMIVSIQIVPGGIDADIKEDCGGKGFSENSDVVSFKSNIESKVTIYYQEPVLKEIVERAIAENILKE